MSPTIRRCVDAIDKAFEQINALVRPDLTLSELEALAPQLGRLETLMGAKDRLDVTVGWIAHSRNAGDLVHSAHPVNFLTEVLGISRSEGYSRIRRGQSRYAPPPPPRVVPAPPQESPEAAAEREAANRAAAQRAAAEQAARKEAEREAQRLRLAAEKDRIIERELAHLNKDAHRGRNELRLEAIRQAATRSPEDLREWLRSAVARANRSSADPFAGHRKRTLTISQPDGDGGVQLNAYLPAPVAAQLIAALRPANNPGFDLPTDATDRRTLPQRRCDQFATFLREWSSGKVRSTGGCGTVVVSMSTADLGLTGSTERGYVTNTGVRLTLADVLALGAARWDLTLIHDTTTGNPLICGRTRRTANLEQRAALVASELVCTHPGCTMPATSCDVHHITAWITGGRTDIENLTLLCRAHHTDNNDARNPAANRGWAERDPVTGRVGYRPPPGSTRQDHNIQFNNSGIAEESAGARIRGRAGPDPGTHPGFTTAA
ncbi:HNH endonuclease [Corynebacterium uberis]|uniref:HNH endonuclease signature motif containing protein n=1 Tax=Corynebacterium uberis TaxID=2883169 RepID=UPI001D0B6CC4|nr:HNH endonuclease signature motif containing protein [Corynebacterium uberis]UDL84845.1 HNH endonuclease [Corynebacterium uberis]